MVNKIKVAKKAEKGRGKWCEWLHSKYQKRYGRSQKNFVEEGGYLYLLEADMERLRASRDAALKICGSIYALVLTITNGDKDSKEFMRLHSNIQNNNFQKNGAEYTKMFEKIIRNFGLYVGMVEEHNRVKWVDGEIILNHDVTLKAIQGIYYNDKSKFYTIDNRLYYLIPITVVVEDMFFAASAIAGGDHALALALGTDEKSKRTHYRNFQRLGFKQGRTFYRYANLLAKYLQRNKPLFEVSYDEAS